LTLSPKKWPRRNDREMALYPYYIYQYIVTLSTGLLIQYSTIQYSPIQYIHTHNVGRNYTHSPPTPAGLACLTFYNNILRVPTLTTQPVRRRERPPCAPYTLWRSHTGNSAFLLWLDCRCIRLPTIAKDANSTTKSVLYVCFTHACIFEPSMRNASCGIYSACWCELGKFD